MNNKKKMIIVALIFLAIGFAAVTTTLVLNGNTLFATKEDDFDVYFSEAILDNVDRSADFISTDGKTITFESNELAKVGEMSILDYTVVNNSTQYDALVTVTCELEGNHYVTVENVLEKEVIEAKSTGTGTLTSKMISKSTEAQNIPLICTLKADAIERETLAEDYIPDGELSTYSLFGYLVDGSDQILPNTTVVVHSTPTYAVSDANGHIYLEGLEKGTHTLYIMGEVDVTSLEGLSEEELKAQAIAYTDFTTSTLNVVCETGHRIVDTVISRTKKYNLTFNPSGGSVELTSKQITRGLPYGELPTPTRDNYDFLGWYLGNELITEESIVLEETAHTLVAKWKAHEYQLSYATENAKYGTVSATIDNETIVSGSIIPHSTEVTLISNVNDGYIFAGWYLEDKLVSMEETYVITMPISNVSYKATYTLDIEAIENINVLNIYPVREDSNSLKTWMETNGYGKDKISVTPVSIRDFNTDLNLYLGTDGAWNYDVVVFGFWDSNSGYDLSETSASVIATYMDSNNPVIFGHDTIRGSSSFVNFISLAHYVGFTVKNWTSNLDTSVVITNDSLFTTYPWNIGKKGDILTIPASHNTGQVLENENNVFLKFNNDIVPDNENFYLTVNGIIAMIQTGHSNGEATDQEQQILANLIFYVYAQTLM